MRKLVIGVNHPCDVVVLDKNGKERFSFILFTDGTIAVTSASNVWIFEDMRVEMMIKNKTTGKGSGGEDKVFHIPDKI